MNALKEVENVGHLYHRTTLHSSTPTSSKSFISLSRLIRCKVQINFLNWTLVTAQILWKLPQTALLFFSTKSKCITICYKWSFLDMRGEHARKHLPISTSSRYRAALIFTRRHLTNVNPIFTLFLLLFWSHQTLEGNICLFLSLLNDPLCSPASH